MSASAFPPRSFADALPLDRVSGLRPGAWICVGAGFSREEVKALVLGRGGALAGPSITGLAELAQPAYCCLSGVADPARCPSSLVDAVCPGQPQLGGPSRMTTPSVTGPIDTMPPTVPTCAADSWMKTYLASEAGLADLGSFHCYVVQPDLNNGLPPSWPDDTTPIATGTAPATSV